ncbi:hypothetical protein INT45_001279 [Circinella minor]|uniref:Uncharacterized protein n=1 Tax=Circinella minor TaxID=1195481 RepID=A0A8H7V887_9FUNG|nr:hypothetical protein INT45_001279 [Circinella minor]
MAAVGEKTLDEMCEEGTKHHFHPIREPLMHWVHTTITHSIDILLQKVHDKYKTKADLLKRIWVLIDCCFDEGELSAIGGEYISRATTESVNANRILAAINAMSR